MSKEILLNPDMLYNWDFKVDARGYRPQEVDKFLDVVIRDYEEYASILKEQENERKDLIEENIRLKQEIRNLRTKIELLSESSTSDVSNTDVLRRLSNLEKIIYGKN